MIHHCVRSLFSVLFLFLTIPSFSIPALPIWQWHTQSDGTKIEVRLVGDEHFSYNVLRDGTPVALRNGNYYYARVNNGILTASTTLAHMKADRKAGEANVAASADDLKSLWQSAMQKAAEARLQGLLSMAKGNKQSLPVRRVAATGKKKGLLILAEFRDTEFRGTDSATIQNFYNRRMNKVGYTDEDGAIGSVHDYFLDQSNGAFDLTFDVVGPIILPRRSSYYGKSTDNANDEHPGQMITDAINAIKGKVNFADYDWDGDGYVDQVFVLYAGEGQATGGSDDTVWPHEWSLSAASYSERGIRPIRINGVIIDTYACSNEIIRLQSGRRTRSFNMGIGVVCHEFSHCLGLPDMYDTSNSSTGFYGTGSWDVMNYGSYNGSPASVTSLTEGIGVVPAGYTAYERSFLGWLTPKELSNNSVNVTGMKGLTDGGEAYRISNTSNSDEYYMLENRSNTRWDSKLAAHGLLVTHVDYNQQAWENNAVNSSQYFYYPHMTVVAADDDLSTESEQGDPYPYAGNDSLTASSSPAFKLYEGSDETLNCKVTNIAKADDGTISFNFTPAPSVTGIRITKMTTKQGTSRIYTLSGQRVDASSLSSLPHGVYIVDGKKVVVK